MSVGLRPPGLLGATAVRLVPDLGLFVTGTPPRSPLNDGRVLHLGARRGRPTTSPLLCSPQLVDPRCGNYQEARSLPLCRGCARRITGPGIDLVPSKVDVAAWYGASIIRAAADPAGGARAEELISGAIDVGVVGVTLPWTPGGRPVPLYELIGPYRQQPGGQAERSAARLRDLGWGRQRRSRWSA